MTFFNKKRKSTIKAQVKIKNLYLITSSIISSYNDKKIVTMYFLAKYEGEEFYELFSGKKLEKINKTESGIIPKKFDTPYIEKVEPFKRHMLNQNEDTIDVQFLFDFITGMNVLNVLGAFSDEAT